MVRKYDLPAAKQVKLGMPTESRKACSSHVILYSSAAQSVVRVPVTVRVPSSAGTRIFSRKEETIVKLYATGDCRDI